MDGINENNENVETLMGLLENSDDAVRQKARHELVEMGFPVIEHLAAVLNGYSTKEVRREVVMALGTINDPAVIRHLALELEDIFPDTAWAAAEGLKKFKKQAWPILLKLLIEKGGNSPLLLRGVHHVLSDQKDPEFDELLQKLLKDMESSSTPEIRLTAAGDILKKMDLQN